nr:hypothetical protein [Tanacetum cinerariifolium]
MAFVVNSVLANNVDLVLETEFASFALQYSTDHQPSIIQKDLNLKLISDEFMTELRKEIFTVMQSMVKMSRQREQAANLSTHTSEPLRFFNFICYDDDDDEEEEERTIPLHDIISQLPPFIVITISPPVLRIEDPGVSLIIGNEELNTIPKKESDEFIKFSVEDLVPIPSESEDTSGSDSECILPFCDDFSPINNFEEKYVTFSNTLFNSNDDFTSSDDELLSDEDVPEENVKIYSNPLFEFDDEYISSDVILFLTRCDDVELLPHHDPSTLKMSIASILKGFTDEPPFKKNDDLFDLESIENKWKKILYDAPIDDLMTDDKVFDPGIHDQIFLQHIFDEGVVISCFCVHSSLIACSLRERMDAS